MYCTVCRIFVKTTEAEKLKTTVAEKLKITKARLVWAGLGCRGSGWPEARLGPLWLGLWLAWIAG